MLKKVPNKRYVTLMLLSVCIGVSTPPAVVADSCVANVRVTNQNRAAIRVLAFRYRLAGNSAVHEEKLENKTVTTNETVNWPGQVLTDAPMDTLVSSTAVEYQVVSDRGAGLVYGPPLTSPWFQSTINCGRGYDYVHYID